MIKPFLHSYVVISTPLGKIKGRLVEVCTSKHNGYGTLLIKARRRVLVVRDWVFIAKAESRKGGDRKNE